MIGAWTINVSGRVYGPFSSERMRSFVGEGRLAPHSLVAREGSADWHEARHEPEFSDAFMQRGGAPVVTSADAKSGPAQPPNSAHAPHANGTPVAEHGAAQFAIIIDQKSQATNLESAINSLGACYRLTHNVWIVSTEQTVSSVRNRLVQELGKADSLFVIDASRGKAAWFNFGPEADVRIRRVWKKT